MVLRHSLRLTYWLAGHKATFQHNGLRAMVISQLLLIMVSAA